MGKRGPKPGQMKTRLRNGNGQFLPVTTPLKAVPTDRFVESVERNFGLRTLVARDLGLSLSHVSKEGHNIEALKEAFWGQRERVKDLAEMQLFAAIQRGEAWAICFYLKTQAKDRGYVERQEIAGAGGGPVTIKVVYEEALTPKGSGDDYMLKAHDGNRQSRDVALVHGH